MLSWKGGRRASMIKKITKKQKITIMYLFFILKILFKINSKKREKK